MEKITNSCDEFSTRFKKIMEIETVINKERDRLAHKIVISGFLILVFLMILSLITVYEQLERFTLGYYCCFVAVWVFARYIMDWVRPYPNFDQYKTAEELEDLLEYYKEKCKQQY